MPIRHSLAAAFAFAAACGASLAHSAPPAETLLEAHAEGLAAWPVSDKDKGLFTALNALGARLDELPDELDLDEPAGDAFSLLWDIANARRAMRVQTSDQPPGVTASAAFAPRGVTADKMLEALVNLATNIGLPVEFGENRTALVDTPVGPVTGSATDKAMTLTFGDVRPVGLDIPGDDLPAGVQPLVSVRANIGRLITTVAPQVADQFAQGGTMPGAAAWAVWMGPDSPDFRFQIGVDKTRTHMTSRVFNAVDAMAAAGYDRHVVFRRDDFKRVPEDAVRLIAAPINLMSYAEMFRSIAEQSGEDPFAIINDELGIDLERDLLANLGPRLYFYQAESTGGGGLMSSVLIVEARDPAALGTAHRRIIDRLNQVAAEQARGYARVRTWDADGIEAYAFTTPGLPIPIEPAWTILNGSLIVALSPTSLRGAIDQVRGGRKSVLDNRMFASAVGRRIPREGAAAVTFTDAPRLVRKGYGMTTLLCAALSNAVRSPGAPDRVDGQILPPFADFVKDVEPSGTVAWWDGDDYRSDAVGDRSVTVLVASTLGSFADVQAVAAPMLAAGVLLPAIGKARQTANQLKSATLVRAIDQGIVVYASNNNDQGPDSLQVLIDEGFITADMLSSPYGPAADGGPDITARLDRPDMANSFDASYIIVIDRAMLVNGEGVINVCFADNHVEPVDRNTLRRMLNDPVNEGAAEALQLPPF